MAKTKKQIEKIYKQPTVYIINFLDVPKEQYAEALDTLFHTPDFIDAVEKRNRLVCNSERMRINSSEMQSLIRVIQQKDHSLADLIFSILVQTNAQSKVTKEFMSFETLLKYYVDYTQDGMSEKVTRLATNLDKITFLADMIENVLTDVKSNMKEVFHDTVQFEQFDAVAQTLKQLSGYFRRTRSSEADPKDQQLYYQYSDSINAYIEKRLKTYTDKYRKRHPAQPVYTEQDMINALNQFFGTDKFFDPNFIKHADSGGIYIDAVKVAFNLTPEQTAKLDSFVKEVPPSTSDGTSKYCFAVTDAIMSQYQPSL